MTFSILARDDETGAIGGAAATGSLCVGGWVLRGNPAAGMSASQGMAPSTFWGEDVLDLMANGENAETAVRAVTEPDAGRAQRQLTALPLVGPGAVFTGKANTPATAGRLFAGGIAAGNMLAGPEVVDALAAGFLNATGSLPARLLAGLGSAHDAGSDSRGLMSAALLVVSPAHAPLSLRIDYADDPLAALAALLERATSGDYAEWARQVPCLDDPERIYGG
jgi:uncharacterized Ntn-hydrolase superfamily protein